MGLQQARHGERVAFVRLHPQRQGLQAAQTQVGVEGALHAAHSVGQESQGSRQLVVVRHRRAADDFAVPVHVLGGGMHHQVRAEG